MSTTSIAESAERTETEETGVQVSVATRLARLAAWILSLYDLLCLGFLSMLLVGSVLSIYATGSVMRNLCSEHLRLTAAMQTDRSE